MESLCLSNFSNVERCFYLSRQFFDDKKAAHPRLLLKKLYFLRKLSLDFFSLMQCVLRDASAK